MGVVVVDVESSDSEKGEVTSAGTFISGGNLFQFRQVTRIVSHMQQDV